MDVDCIYPEKDIMNVNIKYAVETIKNKKFGQLVFVKEVPSERKNTRIALWKCDCGKEKLIRIYSVVGNRIKSCGCLVNGQIGENNPNWVGVGDISGSFWKRKKCSAKKRGIDFTVDKEYV